MLQILIQSDEILLAHRAGPVDPKKGQMMIVRCTPKLKNRMLRNSKNLAKIKNEAGESYYVNVQVSEQIAAKRRENGLRIKQIREDNKGKAVKLQTQYKVKNNELFVDGYKEEKQIQSPTSGEMFPDQQEQEKMEKIKMW